MKKIILTLCLMVPFSTPAMAFKVVHDFDVKIGKFDAAQTQFTYNLSPQDYEVKSTINTNGLFNSLYPFKADYFTSGNIKNDKLISQQYHYQSQSRFNRRHKKLIYDNNGNAIYRISGKNNKNKKVAIPLNQQNSETTDLQSVFAKLAHQYHRLKFCDSRMEVFDGKRRFAVIFQDEGQEHLASSPHSPYSGQAVKCSLYIDKLSSPNDDLLDELTVERPIYFWILEQKGVPFIAQIMIKDTPLGKMNVYTTNVKIED